MIPYRLTLKRRFEKLAAEYFGRVRSSKEIGTFIDQTAVVVASVAGHRCSRVVDLG